MDDDQGLGSSTEDSATNTDASIDLRSCPFCRSAHVAVMEHCGDATAHYWYVNCISCDAEGPPCTTPQGAMHRWNGRDES